MMARTKFNFKNTGRKPQDRKFDTTNTTKVQNIGIKTPLRNSHREEIFDMHQDPRDQIKDNLKNLILTNNGERLCLADFGANLSALAFDYSGQPNFEQLVNQQIMNATQKYMPGLMINEISIASSEGKAKFDANKRGNAELVVRVIYSIPSLRVKDQGLEVVMAIGG